MRQAETEVGRAFRTDGGRGSNPYWRPTANRRIAVGASTSSNGLYRLPSGMWKLRNFPWAKTSTSKWLVPVFGGIAGTITTEQPANAVVK